MTLDITQFKKDLHKGVVSFKYKKKNGEVREAHGTLVNSMLPLIEKREDNAEDKSKRKLPSTSVFYYDLDKQSFRSFLAENLIEWENVAKI